MRKAILVVLVLFFIAAVQAKDVTMNLAFNIGGKSSNVLHVNGTDYATTAGAITFNTLPEKFISAESGNTVLAMIFAGQNFKEARIDTAYSSQDYLISMTQNARNNRFIIGFTNGTSKNIAEKMPSIELFKIAGRTLGSLSIPSQPSFSFFMRFETSADILNSLDFGGRTKLAIANSGKTDGVSGITIRSIG